MSDGFISESRCDSHCVQRMKSYTFASISFLLLVLNLTQGFAEDWKLLYGLRGDWKFELGDDERWSEARFDDSKWETIYAPGYWEDEGFPGYDGYAWYRKRFQADPEWKGKALFLRLGRIDDVDEVYINGKFLGRTGSFPPAYRTAYNMQRDYAIPASFLKSDGDNVIAVRVYDDELGGGIYEGKLGVYEDRSALLPEVSLAGQWSFSTGDSIAWKETNFDDSRWKKILAPGYWEPQGYEDHDGYAWYRTTVRIPADLASKRTILVLGNIDDFDEAYVNGKLVGKTGRLGRDFGPGQSQDYQKLREYTVPSGVLRPNDVNVIAVRVYDGYRDGGIYQGPLGLVSRERYLKWKDANILPKDFFEWLFK